MLNRNQGIACGSAVSKRVQVDLKMLHLVLVSEQQARFLDAFVEEAVHESAFIFIVFNQLSQELFYHLLHVVQINRVPSHDHGHELFVDGLLSNFVDSTEILFSPVVVTCDSEEDDILSQPDYESASLNTSYRSLGAERSSSAFIFPANSSS